MGVLYKPLGILAGMVKKRAGKAASVKVWAQLGHPEGPPSPTAGKQSIAFLAASAALEAATLAAVAAAVDQLFARVFHHLFGAWPGKPPEPEDDERAEPAVEAAAIAA
jgi:hypothetical protein